MKFHYVYTLQSESNSEKFYVGHTDNLQNRLQFHNQKKCKHTLKHIPWKIKTAIAFADKEKALEFEKYLKTASGRAFAKKRL
jgi:predicted GIY-YIG superfamily endonuclease